MNTIDSAQQELIQEFALFDDWLDRYQYLIELGRKLDPFPEAAKTDANKLRGCQSQVWLHASEGANGALHFDAVSDAAIVSGLIAVLMRIYNDRDPRDIVELEPDFVSAIGLDTHLSPTRSNGLAAMIAAIRQHAVQALAATA